MAGEIRSRNVTVSHHRKHGKAARPMGYPGEPDNYPRRRDTGTLKRSIPHEMSCPDCSQVHDPEFHESCKEIEAIRVELAQAKQARRKGTQSFGPR